DVDPPLWLTPPATRWHGHRLPQCLEIKRREPYFGCESALPAPTIENSQNQDTFAMASHIVRLAPPRGHPPSRRPVLPRTPQTPARVHFWQGASGRRYRHGVYSLLDCPPQPRTVYLLVRRDLNGAATVLGIHAAVSEAPTLNLAQIRQRGATLGANEVHAHALESGDEAGHTIVCDLRAGVFGALAATATDATAG